MANTIAGFGFRGGQLITSAASNSAANIAQIAYNDTIPLGFGAPVKQLNTGFITGTATTFGTSGMYGIFCGCWYTDSTAQGGIRFSPNWPGVALSSSSTVVNAFVITDPNAVFLAQYQGTALAQTNIGNNIDVVSGTADNVDGAGQSTCYLDATGALGTTALPFRIVGILGVGQYASAVPPTPGGSVTADNGWVYVKINNSTLFSSTTGV